MKSKKFTVALLISFISILATPLAAALDMPLLSWERGKQQSIVLGGSSTDAGWKIFLISPGQKEIEFSRSATNEAGYVVFSVDLPNNLKVGGYSVEARAKGAESNIVAAINVIPRKYYTISSIPTDLRLLFTLYAIVVSYFAIIRSRRYSTLTFSRDASHRRKKGEDLASSRVPASIQPFYKFRSRRQAEMEISFLKFVAYKDGEPLHKFAPVVWAILPFLTFVLGIYMSYSIQETTVIPNVAIPLLLLVVVIGAIDSISGGTAALGFIFASFILGDITGMRTFLATAAFVMAWCIPSMLASMYLLTLRVDFKHNFARLSEKVKSFVALLTSAIFGSTAVVISAILTDSLVINIQGDAILRWPLMALTALIIFGKNFAETLLDENRVRREKEVSTLIESITLRPVFSSGMAFFLAASIFGIVYVWTERAAQSIFATIIISLPFLLNAASGPKVTLKRFKVIQRNVLLEAGLISILTIVIYEVIQYLPMSTREKAQAFILIGLAPVLLHSIYSLLAASIERSHLESGEADE